MKNKKRLLALLLAGTMVFAAGCGDNQDAGAAGAGAKDSMEENAGDVPAGAGQEEESAEAEPQKEEWEKSEHINHELFIALTKLEMDDEKGEGTAYLHLENEKEDGVLSIEGMEIYVDGMKSEDVKTSDSAFGLDVEESRDVTVHFSNPITWKKLSECGAIEIEMNITGSTYYGVDFFLKGDKDSIKEYTLIVEEAEVYNDNGLSITVTGLDTSTGQLTFHFANNNSEVVYRSITYCDVYIDDTLMEGGEHWDIFGYTSGMIDGNANMIDSLDGVVYLNGDWKNLLKNEPNNITLTFTIRDEVWYDPNLVVVDKFQVTIPVTMSE